MTKQTLLFVIAAGALALIVTRLSGGKVGEKGVHELNWTQDFAAAQATAQAEDKPILMLFTGSDWCYYCIKMEAEVLTQKAFADYGNSELVLFKADFPRGEELSDSVRSQNEALAGEYGIQGFPTFILLNGDDKVAGKWVGFVDGGPEGFVSKIKASL